MADYDETYDFDPYSDATTYFDFFCDNVESGDQCVNEPTDNANAPDWQWTDDEGSPSGSTGPPTTPTEGCVFPESSSPMANGDISTCTLKAAYEANAGAYALYVTARICRFGNASGMMYLEAWDGDSWEILASWAGNGSQTWVDVGPYDCTAWTNDDFKVRFRVVNGGTTYQNDFAISVIRIYGDSKVSYHLAGVTKDKDGNTKATCKCMLIKDNLDNTYSFIAYDESDGSGNYDFTGLPDNDAQYGVIAWKDDTPHVFDTGDHVLQPVAE